MNILAFMGWASHDSGACVIKTEADGSFRFVSISEERLNRVKYSYHFPLRSIEYCMNSLGIESLDDIDIVVNDWSHECETFNTNKSHRKLEYDYLKRKLNIPKHKVKHIPAHHLAHAYSAFIPSGFEDAAILVVDALGTDLQGTSLYHGKGTQVELVESSGSFSIGKLYDAVTRKVLNFAVGEDGKTMGLAAFGEEHDDLPEILNIQARYEGLNIDYSNFMRRIPDNGLLNTDVIPCPDKQNIFDPYYARVAFEVQEEAERAMMHLAQYAKEKTGAKKLCIAGGVGLNCVANEKIRLSGMFEDVFIQPASSDAGIPFGLALYGYYNFYENATYKPPFKNAYVGTEYENSEVEDLFQKFDIPYKETDLPEVAKLISEKNVIGWHYGSSEFGPRALGHRSILADPSYADMKAILNAKVKHREAYRPFAPVVLSEYADEYFELGGEESAFMLLAPMIKEDKRDKIPAVVHVDGSGRVQTIKKENCEAFYGLINELYKITGIPVIVNTSFNDNNEPIVETPLDSLLCFLRTNIDYLVINGRYLVAKKDITDRQHKIDVISDSRQNSLKSDYKRLIGEFMSSYSVNELKEYLSLNANISAHYKNYQAYEKLIDTLKSGKQFLYVGDQFHLDLVSDICKEFYQEPSLEVLKVIDDKMNNLDELASCVTKNSGGMPVLVGAYNLSRELKDRLPTDSNALFIYEDFQVHLSNVVSTGHTQYVDLDGVDDFSREINHSTDFDSLFSKLR